MPATVSVSPAAISARPITGSSGSTGSQSRLALSPSSAPSVSITPLGGY